MKKVAISLTLLLVSLSLALAKDFWEKPFTEWKYDEVIKMLEDSPWAGKVTHTSQRQGRGTTNVAGEMEIYNQYTIRFFSSKPIRSAYVRMMMLMNKFDEMSQEDQAAFEQKFAPALRDFDDQVIINLDFATNDRQASMEVDRQLKQMTSELLKQNAYLISDRLGRVEIKEYYPPSPDGTGAKFVYPREVDGKPVVEKGDKEVKFELYVPGTGEKIFQVWKVKDMIYEGKLSF